MAILGLDLDLGLWVTESAAVSLAGLGNFGCNSAAVSLAGLGDFGCIN